jgi:hypothetical protein
MPFPEIEVEVMPIEKQLSEREILDKKLHDRLFNSGSGDKLIEPKSKGGSRSRSQSKSNLRLSTKGSKKSFT